MAKAKNISISVRLCIVLLALHLACTGCQSTSKGKRPAKAIDGQFVVDGPSKFMGLPLESGQIILSDAGGPVSVFFSLLAEEYYSYLHAGILIIEDGKPYVYEALGNYLPISGQAPTEAIIGGGITRTKLASFVARKMIVAIYNPSPAINREAMISFAQRHYKARTPFDPFFDNTDREKLYCTEFVAAALEAGGVKKNHTVPYSRNNPSLDVVLDWLKITAETSIPAGSLVRPENYIGTISSTRSITRIRTFFELKRELHARFTTDQRLGYLFSFSNGKLKFRDSIRAFILKGVKLYDLTDTPPDDATMRLGVQRFAEEFFGPG